MAWYPIPSSIHGVGRFSNGETIFKVGDEVGNVSNPSWNYELKVFNIPGVAKPVLGKKDSRYDTVFGISSAEYWNNVKPDDQLDGFALFASIAEVGSAQLSQAVAGTVNLWMDSNSKVVATAPSGGGGALTIAIPTGGTVVITTQPQYGTVTVSGTNIQYTASNGYTGADSFGYDIKGATGEVLNSGTCSFSTSSATATATPVFAKATIDVSGDIRVNCVAGAAVTLYKNGDSNIVGTITDSSNVGYVLFSNIARIQGDFYKAKAQKSGLTISGFSVISTTKRKPMAFVGVTKTVAAGGSVQIALTELVHDSENAGLF